MAISGTLATVFRQQQGVAGTPFTDKPTTADAAYKRYQINDTTLRYWDRTVPVTVKKNGVVQTTGFTIEHLSGFVAFTAANINTDVIIVSGTSLPVAEAGGMFGWKLEPSTELEDTTTFADNGYKSFTATLNGFGGSCEAYWSNGDNTNHLLAGGDVIMVLYVDDTPGSTKRYEGFAQFKKQTVETAVKGVVKESIDYEGDGALYYREG